MQPDWRRIVGSAALGIAAFLWLFRDRLHLLVSIDDALVVLVIVLILAVIAYRAWPAFPIIWNLLRTPAGRQAMRPTLFHLAGAMGFAALVMVLQLLFLRTLSSSITVHWPSALRSLLILTLVGYFVFPWIYVRWRRWRTRQQANRLH